VETEIVISYLWILIRMYRAKHRGGGPGIRIFSKMSGIEGLTVVART